MGYVMQTNEREVQRLIDAAVGRALLDARFAEDLLADPTLSAGGPGLHAPALSRATRYSSARPARLCQPGAGAVLAQQPAPSAEVEQALAVGL